MSDNHDNRSHDEALRLDNEDLHLLIERIGNILSKYNDLDDHDGDSNEIEKERQHHLEILQQLLADLHPADIAEILNSLSAHNRHIVWEQVPAHLEGDILLEADDWLQESLIRHMSREDLLAASAQLDPDELVDLAPNLPEGIVAEVQKGLTAVEREQLIAAMGYPEGTVGALMDFDMVRVRDDVSLEVVLRYLRRLADLPDHTDQLYIVDRTDRLQGILTLEQLLTNNPDTIVGDVMQSEYLAFNPNDDDADASSAFERYDLVSAPVVDKQNRLIGRITIAEIVDLIREESEEESLSRAGMNNEDIFAPVLHGIKRRIPWFLVNLCTAATASLIASQFEATVNHIVILAFLMSIVAGIGGNSGNQSMTLVIRALNDEHILTTTSMILRMVFREVRVTFTIGALGGIVACVFAWIFSGRLDIGLVMMAALMLNMLLGSILGVVIPLLRLRFGKDPAIGSSIMLTFATDSLGFLIFLGLATIFLIPHH